MIQNLQGINKDDKKSLLELTEHCSSHLNNYSGYSWKIVFFVKRIFQINGVINRQNVKTCANDRPEQYSSTALKSAVTMKWFVIFSEIVEALI